MHLRGSDFVQLPVEPLIAYHRRFGARHIGAHYCDQFAEPNYAISQVCGEGQLLRSDGRDEGRTRAEFAEGSDKSDFFEMVNC